MRAVGQNPLAKLDDETLILADVGRKALDQVTGATTELLATRMPRDQARALAEKLASGTWTHDYPIPAAEAKALGLPVATEMPDDVLTLMTLYPQPVRHSGGVEYLPVPREVPRKADKTRR